MEEMIDSNESVSNHTCLSSVQDLSMTGRAVSCPRGFAGAIFAGQCPSGVVTEFNADGPNAQAIRQGTKPGGRACTACAARRSKNALQWPDTPQFCEVVVSYLFQ